MMNKVFATALSFGAILLLAGCKPQFSPSKAKGIDSESWKTVIPESCQSFFDGCNQCTKTADGEAACTEMYCEKYDTPKCLDDENSGDQQMGIANPASEYCVAQGGESLIKSDKDGNEHGVCLINGKEHDEWDFYTTAMQKVSDEMAKTYVGRSLAEVQKEFETAGAVLRVVSEDADHKAITADYRPERLNVEVEKGVITNAYFG